MVQRPSERERGRVEEKVRERQKERRRGEREREGGESDIYARETQKDRKCVLYMQQEYMWIERLTIKYYSIQFIN